MKITKSLRNVQRAVAEYRCEDIIWDGSYGGSDGLLYKLKIFRFSIRRHCGKFMYRVRVCYVDKSECRKHVNWKKLSPIWYACKCPFCSYTERR